MNLKNKGETIVEILIATTIMVLIITSTFVILFRAMATNTSIKNRVRALNVAREGIEGVRNIRDTNWIRYSGDRRNRWLCRPGISTGSVNSIPNTNPHSFSNPIESDGWYSEQLVRDERANSSFEDFVHDCFEDVSGNPIEIESGYYALEYLLRQRGSSSGGNQQIGSYILEPQLAIGGDLNTNKEQFRLYWSSNDSRLTHASEAYRYDEFNDLLTTPDIYPPSIFYRIIEIDIAPVFDDPDNPGNCIQEGGSNPAVDPSCNLEKMIVRSQVTWDENDDGNFDSVTLETQLFDYFQRTSY